MKWLRRRTVPRPLTADERSLIERIENERARLERSQEEVEIVDYGARTPLEQLSAAEMAQGARLRRTVGDICRQSSKPAADARFLFDLIREHRPQRCLELGTCLGISAAYQAGALALNGGEGTLLTIEGAEALAVRARQVLDRLGLGERAAVYVGRFSDVLPTLLHDHMFDYAFVDGHHDERATLDYFSAIRPRLRRGGALVFDDINWSNGMQRAWRVIRSSDTVTSPLERSGLGVVTAT